MRQHGSARFEPYYKLQIWQERSFAWVDIQKAYDSEAEARAASLLAVPQGAKWRIMRITEKGREPIA